MSVVDQRRSLGLSDSELQRSTRRCSQIPLYGTCVCAALTLVACTLTTSLDFVGNGPGTKTSTAKGGGSFSSASGTDGGTGGNGVASAGSGAITANGTAGTGGDTSVIGGAAGTTAEAGASGAAGATGTPIPVCDDTCAESGSCSGNSCQCPSGMPACSNGCSDAIEASGFCGTCGNTCADDQQCVSGACQCLETGKASCSSGCVNLDSDLEHCGKCEHACNQGQLCIAGACRSSPCDDFCSNAEPMPTASDGFRTGNIGTNERCYAVSDYVPTQTQARIVCWQFAPARTLKVNGAITPCIRDNGGAVLKRQPDGWYCVQVGAGDWGDGALLLPIY